MMINEQFNQQYFNPPQQRALLAMPNTGSHVMGRATGKSEGIGAPTLVDWIENMPCAAIGVVCRTFMQAADRTLPPLYAAWRRMGYYKNVHYWVGRKPPENLKIPSPFYSPDKEAEKHAIFWYTGAYLSIISQDRPGSANGKTLDAIYGDEAKLLIKKKYDTEISKASRGNVREFAHYCGHGGTLFLTDMPTTPESKWILEHEGYNDLWIKKYGIKYKMSELIKLISHLQLFVNNLKYKLYQDITIERKKVIKRQIRSEEKLLNYLRQETAMYSEASSLENIHFIGIKKVKMWKRDDLDVDFRTQVLNERLYVTENGFYPGLNLENQAYDKHDYSQIDLAGGLWLPDGVRKGCLNDGDINRNQALDIAMDAGARINCLVVGQECAQEYRILNALYVKHPKRLIDVVNNFCDYYEAHPYKTVNFFYDHTFVGTDATRVFSYADEVNRILSARKWKVNMINIGQQPGHETRYRMWGSVLKEDDSRVKMVRFNRNNCDKLLIAMQCAGVLQGSKGIQKDKRPEKRSDVPQEEATHLTDALDTIYIGRFKHQLGYAEVVTEAIWS